MLPPSEWPRLAGTEAETVWPLLTPERTSVVVVEQGDQVVGCHVLVWVLHCECVWIHPAHRGKGSVARRLWAAVERTARDVWRSRTVLTTVTTESVRRLVAHLGGVPVPGDQYVITVKE